MSTKDELDLAQLGDSYKMFGELAGRDDAQVVLATRKTDGLPVQIAVYREPAGDQGNALSHLASDANLLEGTPHPAVVRIIESRWVGNEALAIVTERVDARSLEDLLSRREQEFPFPRIATLLRELNAVITWARERGVVNRGLRLDTVYAEDGSDRVRVMFTARPLPGNGIPDERDDARTIATLARAMMTRSVADPERDSLPLEELRPGLPARVVQQTEALLGRADSVESVDVRAYIAAIAMAEELKLGEQEYARVMREMSEEQEAIRAELAAERKAHEEDLAEQARRFEKEAQKQRSQIAKEQAKLAREREAFERQRAKGREQIAAKLAAIQAHAELYARTSELPVHLAEPLPEPEPELEFVDAEETDEEPFDEIAEDPVKDEGAPVAPAAPEARPPMRLPPSWSSRTPGTARIRRFGLAAIALAVVVVVVAALAFGRRGEQGGVQVSGRPPGIELRTVDSLAGVTVPAVVDSTPPLASATAPAPVRRRPARPVRSDTVVPPADTVAASVTGVPAPITPPVSMPLPLSRTDSVLPQDSIARRDSLVRRDTLIVPRRDTLPVPGSASRGGVR